MNRLTLVVGLLILVVGVPMWLFPEDPYHRLGFILTVTGIIVLIAGIFKKNKRSD